VLAWTLALLAACSTETTPPPPPAAPSPLDQSWITTVVAEPQAFAQLIDAGPRDAWVAYHQGDWSAAARLARDFGLRARAEAQQAQLYEDLAGLEAEAWPLLASRWQERDPSVSDGPLPFLAALVLARAGQGPSALATPGLDPDQRAAIEALSGGPALSPEAALDPRGCLKASIAIWRGEHSGPVCPHRQALLIGGEERFTNPLAIAAGASLAKRAAQTSATPSEGLAASLFGDAWAPSTLAGLDLPDAGSSDDVQAARERARAFDAALETWSASLQERSTEDGRALLADLRLVEAARNRVLVDWARQALAEGHPHQAAAWLMLAHDVEQGRSIGPLNPPQRFALAARADLQTGRARQALDHLDALDGTVPELPALVEALGDLVVLEGLGRGGDSKEH